MWASGICRPVAHVVRRTPGSSAQSWSPMSSPCQAQSSTPLRNRTYERHNMIVCMRQCGGAQRTEGLIRRRTSGLWQLRACGQPVEACPATQHGFKVKFIWSTSCCAQGTARPLASKCTTSCTHALTRTHSRRRAPLSGKPPPLRPEGNSKGWQWGLFVLMQGE